MNHVWTVVCERSLIDKDSNNLSLINVIEQIQIGSLEEIPEGAPPPTGGGRIEVVTMWSRSNLETPETTNTRTIFYSPTGDELVRNEPYIDLTEFKRLRARWLYIGLPPYSGDGQYTFVVQQEVDGEWRTEAEVPLEISKIPSEQ